MNAFKNRGLESKMWRKHKSTKSERWRKFGKEAYNWRRWNREKRALSFETGWIRKIENLSRRQSNEILAENPRHKWTPPPSPTCNFQRLQNALAPQAVQFCCLWKIYSCLLKKSALEIILIPKQIICVTLV